MRFCYIARGSVTEVQSHLALAHELGYLPDEIYQGMILEAESIGRQLNNYISYLKRSKQGDKEFLSSHLLREEDEAYALENPNE